MRNKVRHIVWAVAQPGQFVRGALSGLYMRAMGTVMSLLSGLSVLSAMSVMLVMLGACNRESDGWHRHEETLITLSLRLPNGSSGSGGSGSSSDSRNSGSTRSTRALLTDPNEENLIESIHILALTQNSSQEWVFDYMATDVTLTNDNDNHITVTASVRQLPTPQQFVIIANGASELNDAAPVRGESIEAIQNRLICTTGGGEWPARNNGVELFKPIPMYGRTTSYTVQSTGNHAITNPATQMIRMLARIDVTLKSTVTNFILEEACLFNYKTAGYVSYVNSDFDDQTNAVTKPAVPEMGNHTGSPILEPAVLYTSDKTHDARGVIRHSIYTFESPALLAGEDAVTGIALVVGGIFGGLSQKTYYRIDLKTADDATENISSGILRNHVYAVEIQQVSGSGQPTAKEAYLGSPNLNAVVKGWNVMEQNVNGKQYYLNVSETSVKLTIDNSFTRTITAQTNYDTDEKGFQAGIQVDTENITYSADGSTYDLPETSADNWLEVENIGTDTDAELVFSVSELVEIETIVNRYAKLKLSAGNFTRMIDVEI